MSPGPSSFITSCRRGGGGRWTSLHESTSVCPSLLISSFTIPLSIHPSTGYTSPLHRLNNLYLFALSTHTQAQELCTIHTSRDVHRRGLRLLGQLPVCPPRLKLPLRRKYIYFLNIIITAAEHHVIEEYASRGRGRGGGGYTN